MFAATLAEASDDRYVAALLEGALSGRVEYPDGTTTLWRPVGPAELELIRVSGWRAFPPRLPDQPICYPVLSEAYAVRIAREWNVTASGAGYVTEGSGSRPAALAATRVGLPAATACGSCGCRRRSWPGSVLVAPPGWSGDWGRPGERGANRVPGRVPGAW